MTVLLVALTIQAMRSEAPRWAISTSFACAAVAIGLAVVRVFGAARRLGTRNDPVAIQSRLARGILRDHLVCLVGITALLAVQLAVA